MADYEIEELCGPHALGEGPHWDEERQCLYYVDCFDATICRYVPAEKRLVSCKVEQAEHISIVIPVKGSPDKFIISMRKKLGLITWDGESSTPADVKVLTSVDNEPGLERNIFNDGKVDPTGRLWVGTLSDLRSDDLWTAKRGSLFSFSNTLQPTKRESGIIIANGLAWSPDLKFMYYIDTGKKTVDTFDFDASTGEIQNRRVAFDFSTVAGVPEHGGPDGMTIDTDGNLWIAVFGSSGVFQIDPHTGKLLRVVTIPNSSQITSVAFGGANLDELYVVSGCFLLGDRIKDYPSAGKTFRITGLGVKGTPMLPVDLNKSLL